MKIFVVVPAYNEDRRMGKFLSELVKTKLPIVVVDDGSEDKTFEAIKKQKVVALRHKINLGKGAALKTGCQAAFSLGADAVILMDSDGQHKVEDLPEFTKALKTGEYDIIFGSRNLNHGVPLERYVGNKLASILVNILFGIYVSDLICGYRAITKKAFRLLDWESTGYGVETEMVAKCGKLGLRHCEVPVATVYYDKFKGVSVIDAIGIFFDVFRWRINK